MGIDRGRNGCDLTGYECFLAEPEVAERIRIVKRPRVGVDYAGVWAKRLLRFYIEGTGFVSKR